MAAVDVDGSTYNYVVDTREDVKTPVTPIEAPKAESFTLDIPVAYSEGYKVKALQDERLKPYLASAKYTTDTNYRLVLNLAGSVSRDQLESLVKTIIDEYAKKA